MLNLVCSHMTLNYIFDLLTISINCCEDNQLSNFPCLRHTIFVLFSILFLVSFDFRWKSSIHRFFVSIIGSNRMMALSFKGCLLSIICEKMFKEPKKLNFRLFLEILEEFFCEKYAKKKNYVRKEFCISIWYQWYKNQSVKLVNSIEFYVEFLENINNILLNDIKMKLLKKVKEIACNRRMCGF